MKLQSLKKIVLEWVYIEDGCKDEMLETYFFSIKFVEESSEKILIE